LGNFTINRYSRIEPGPDRIRVRYVLDMAEIPAFQEMAGIDLDRDGQVNSQEHASYLVNKAEELKRGLYLLVDDRPVPLQVVDQELSFPPGQGGLPTLRLSLGLQGQLRSSSGEQRLYYRDDNYAQRLGWKEIVVRPGAGVSLVNATAPQQDRSNELRNYPEDFLSRPPDQREAHLTMVIDAAANTAESAQVAAAVPSGRNNRDPLTSLLMAERLSVPVVILSFALALGLGALHAISPGHGKTIMAAYLVGTRGTGRHALFLGLTVTVSHTLGVLGLGLVTLYASHLITPERLYPWLGLVSGATVMAIGAWLLLGQVWRRRLTSLDRSRSVPDHHHAHAHGHSHSHQPRGSNTLRITWRNLAALGIAGGLLPSASALVILLAAISLHRTGFGLLLILAFSTGMAAVLAGIGLMMVYAGKIVERFQSQNRLVGAVTAALPMATALVVLISGVVVTARAAFQVGLL
jgi:ABC-type nickel/cobalt efflux system permease component RcnA